ncbi:MAG: RCKP-type rubredoxin-like domain-containing protein [Moorellales bacterium]
MIGVSWLALWQCRRCGYEKEARCKPKKCPECGEKEGFERKPAGTNPITASKAGPDGGDKQCDL